VRTGGSRIGWVVVTLATLALPASAQEQGWHYSPLDGEGDRATLGCAYNSTPQSFSCIAVRCEDDYTVGVHLHTSRPGGDAGRWRIDIDREAGFEVDAKADGAPYHAKLAGDVTEVIEAIKNGGVAYLDPKAGPELPTNGIPLSGSLHAINQALFFCAPRVPSVPDDGPTDGKDSAER